MNVPGFSAEATLYRSVGSYRMIAGVSATRMVSPMARCCSACDSICEACDNCDPSECLGHRNCCLPLCRGCFRCLNGCLENC
jgi:hypothetical protein